MKSKNAQSGVLRKAIGCDRTAGYAQKNVGATHYIEIHINRPFVFVYAALLERVERATNHRTKKLVGTLGKLFVKCETYRGVLL